MFYKIKIMKKSFTYNYSFDYSFAVVDGSINDLKYLKNKLDDNFFKSQLINSFNKLHLRFYGDIHKMVNYINKLD